MKLVGEFEIEELPQTINVLLSKGFRNRASHAKKWHNLIHLQCLHHRIANLNLKTARLTLTRYSSSELDFDGLVSSWKHCIDGLVVAKVIANDKVENIGQSVFLWEKAKPKEGKIRIKIETTEELT